MTINTFSKSLKNEVSFDSSTVAERQAAIGRLVGNVKTTTFDNKVRLFALAPLAVAEYDEILSNSDIKRTASEHAEMLGVKAPMFSMMRQVVTILSYGAGHERDGGWGDVTIGTDKVNVATAWDRLVNYRSDHRDPKDVVCPLAYAVGYVLGEDVERRFEGIVEVFESFPGGMSGLYNLARGRNADGTKVSDDRTPEEDGEEDAPEEDAPTSGLDMITQAIGVARSQGVSDADIASHVMKVLSV